MTTRNPGNEGRFGPVRRRAADQELGDAVTPPAVDDIDADDDAFQKAHGFRRSRHPYDADRTRQRLRDIADQVADARALVAGGWDAFIAPTFDGTMRRRTGERIIEIVAEAGAKLHSDYKLRTPAPWRQMYGMRTVVVHHYDRTDDALVWSVLSENIPALAQALHLPVDPDDEIPLPGGLV